MLHAGTWLYLACLILGATTSRSATVTTLPATLITNNMATLNGMANPLGTSTTGFFEYGTTTSYGFTTPSLGLGAGESNVPFSRLVTGLAGGQTYHFRASATSFSSPFSITYTLHWQVAWWRPACTTRARAISVPLSAGRR